MAYARRRGRSSRTYRKKASRSTRRSSYRSGYRRSSGRTRTYRKKASRMTKRKVLNTTAIKKRDTILPQTNPTLDAALAGQILPAVLKPGRPIPNGTPAYTYCIPWIATARQTASGNAPAAQLAKMTTGKPYFVGLSEQVTISVTGPVPPAAQLAKMTTGKPYFVGLSEQVTISVTGPVPWQWRRVCFTFKGPTIVGKFTDTDYSPVAEYAPEKYFRQSFDNDVGEYRPLFDLASYRGDGVSKTTYPEALEKLYRYIFLGASAQFTDDPTAADWINVMDAKTDSTRVKICYDKTITIASGNEEGVQRNYRRYHPMNQYLQYDQVEIGGNYGFSDYSTSGKPGMGDYYVVDLFQARYGADGESGDLIFDPRATLYWHER
nr:MAG: capsid protein [Rhinopithecus-associated genomovirus 4]